MECVRADISNLEAIQPAFEGIDVVVHLAAFLGGEVWEAHLSSNIIGAYNVYEAARRAGVAGSFLLAVAQPRRASSKHLPTTRLSQAVTTSYLSASSGSPPRRPGRPVFTVLQKVWGEVIGRHFSDAYGLSVLCVRIGRVNEENRPTNLSEFSRYLSHRDIEHPRAVLGYVPQDSAEALRWGGSK